MRRSLSSSEEQTLAMGEEFAGGLHAGDVVAVYGDLGSGKTRFIKGICKGLGVREHVVSPTFTIVTEYQYPGGRVYHFDFYRLRSTDELKEIGFDEYLSGEGICIIEWADRVQAFLPERRFNVRLDYGASTDVRAITIEQSQEMIS